jgi:hypothetical protein
MIVHETPGMDLPAGLPAGFAQGFGEAKPIFVTAEDGFAAVAAIHDVVDGARVFDAEFAGHAGRLWKTASTVNAKTCEYAGLTPACRALAFTSSRWSSLRFTSPETQRTFARRGRGLRLTAWPRLILPRGETTCSFKPKCDETSVSRMGGFEPAKSEWFELAK